LQGRQESASVRHASVLSTVLGIWLAGAAVIGPAYAAPCGGDFSAWLDAFRHDATKHGVSPEVVAGALDGVTEDPKVVTLDHSQHVFKQTFEQFSGRMVSPQRLKKGAALMRQHQAMLARIEATYAVPGPVLVAIWGLETDYGVNIGKFATIRSLATLAHDCRRTDRFQAELLSALQIVQRGDLRAAEMRGAWAGEIGQTQFLPSSYLRFAVDFDGDGRRDLIHSAADVLASTANYLKGYGWQRGEGWNEGAPNFAVLGEWNKAEVYRKTIALFADRLASGEQPATGNPVAKAK
jgi:lytic murein transglycosylase